ncbi:MAG: enolase C-terminal domain-like protein [bacterium]
MSELLKIQAVHTFRLSIPFKTGAVSAPGSGDKVENIIVSLDTDTGLVGWGCAAFSAADAEFGYETIREKLAPPLMESFSAPVGKILESISKIAPDNPAARAALDIAVHDLWGKQLSASLTSVLGSYRTSFVTSASIGACGLDESVGLAGKYVETGFKALKLYCGDDAEHEIERVKAIKKEHASVAVRLCSGGFNAKNAKKIIDALAGDIELFEQNITDKNIDEFAKLAAESAVPVVFGGSVSNSAGALSIFQKGFQLINLKLMDCGGVAEAMRICNIAQTLGKKIVIGSMEEIPISMGAAAHLALSHPAIAYAELDGYLNLDQHAASNGIVIENGMVLVVDRPGLGVEIRKKYLR